MTSNYGVLRSLQGRMDDNTREDKGPMATIIESVIQLIFLHLKLDINSPELHGFKFVIVSGKKTFPMIILRDIDEEDRHRKGTCECAHYCYGASYRQRHYGTPLYPSISNNIKLPIRKYIPTFDHNHGQMVTYKNQWNIEPEFFSNSFVYFNIMDILKENK